MDRKSGCRERLEKLKEIEELSLRFFFFFVRFVDFFSEHFFLDRIALSVSFRTTFIFEK